jgi:hypothetical protein
LLSNPLHCGSYRRVVISVCRRKLIIIFLLSWRKLVIFLFRSCHGRSRGSGRRVALRKAANALSTRSTPLALCRSNCRLFRGKVVVLVLLGRKLIILRRRRESRFIVLVLLGRKLIIFPNTPRRSRFTKAAPTTCGSLSDRRSEADSSKVFLERSDLDRVTHRTHA